MDATARAATQGRTMTKPQIATTTHPIELTLAQLADVRDGNASMREEIERLRRVLRGGEQEEARLETELKEFLDKRLK